MRMVKQTRMVWAYMQYTGRDKSLVTNITGQSSSWKAIGVSSSRVNAQHLVEDSLPCIKYHVILLYPESDNFVHALSLFFFRSISIFSSTLRSLKCSLYFRFPYRTPVCISIPRFRCHITCTYDRPSYIIRVLFDDDKNQKAPQCAIFSSLLLFFLS